MEETTLFNPQSYAVIIEQILTNHCLGKIGDADLIRKDPIGFIDCALSVYESESKENEKKAIIFWDKYEQYNGKSFDLLGKEITKEITESIIELFK